MPSKKWLEKYEIAKKYYEEHGNLLMTTKYVTEDKVNIGRWILFNRQYYKLNKLTQEQIDLLNQIGMYWNAKKKDSFGYTWKEMYDLAKDYYQKHGDINVHYNDQDEKGKKLYKWLVRQRECYFNNKLGKEKIKLLKKIGMNLENTIPYKWMQTYELAKKYYLKHKNLRIPFNYVTEDGVKLGWWIVTQRRVRKGLKMGMLDNDQVRLLDKIGMVWSLESDLVKQKLEINKKNPNRKDIWLAKYDLVKNYYERYGNIDIPSNFKTSEGTIYYEEGINIYAWLRTQKEAYKGNSNVKLTDKEIELLEKLNILWFKDSVDKKLQKVKITEKNKKIKEIEILNRFRSYLLKYDNNSLPSKEEINSGFVKVLSKGE